MDFYPKFADCFERVIPRMRETMYNSSFASAKLFTNCVETVSNRCRKVDEYEKNCHFCLDCRHLTRLWL